ncbi:MAG: UDP-N-acetylglucosamine 2-epimerase (non-hydrolyzing) [Deltaproteobacteria bacterium HGW-Deltaproteobacteria-1]|jgi:UDP-N-acetylglucosamine 2-epimerase|nr:MAG: UDP-N-acetylglucosamine 2-epimerase (non-hydrolyzing) [Deltaproteobacteria bacterium HGW-Deltaproteobacteria-1]
MKIVTIIGARPQFIKAAAVSRAIGRYNDQTSNSEHRTLNEVIIHTGQHYDEGMSAVFFRELEIPEPLYNIGIGSGPHGQQTGRMIEAIEKLLMTEKPDWVLVYGDTNSTLAGALAAAKLHIPVAHVEAGLRSFNRRMPEEINRVLTDHLSTLLFCPSQVAVDNLAAEGISSKRAPDSSPLTPQILVVGDVMADALQFAANKVDTNSDILNCLGLKPHHYLLATIHRAENTDNPERLGNIMSALSELAKREPVVLPLHPRTKKILTASHPSVLVSDSLLRIIEPVGYFDVIALARSSRVILTDSGGMQKEAYWLKVPCITLRDETEWVETVETGWNVLTGADEKKISNTAQNFTPPAEHPSLYGDGQAAKRVIDILVERTADMRK